MNDIFSKIRKKGIIIFKIRFADDTCFCPAGFQFLSNISPGICHYESKNGIIPPYGI